jgi:hypothetical protein
MGPTEVVYIASNWNSFAEFLEHNQFVVDKSDQIKLLREMEEGVTTLIVNPPRRQVSVARIWIHRGNGNEFLIKEKEMDHKDSCLRYRNCLLAEKIKATEDVFGAGTRVIEKQLGLPVSSISFDRDSHRTFYEDQDSQSFIGLITRRQYEDVHCTIQGLPCHDFITEMGDVTYYWKWMQDVYN